MSDDFLVQVFIFTVIANFLLFPLIGKSKFFVKLWSLNLVIGILLIVYFLKSGVFVSH